MAQKQAQAFEYGEEEKYSGLRGCVYRPMTQYTPDTAEAQRLRREQTYQRIFAVFFGPDDVLRSGWRLLLFVFLFTIFAAFLFMSLWPMLGLNQHGASPLLPLASDGIQLLALTLAAFLLGKIERRPAVRIGLEDGRGRVPRFLWGCWWGIGLLSGLVLLMARAGLFTISLAGLSPSTAIHFGLLQAVAFLTVAFFEEALFRGYLQSILARGVGFWPAAVLLAAAFGFVHGYNPGESPVGLCTAALIGFIFAMSRWYTGSLWWAVGFHAAWDWGQSYLFGTPDSGLLLSGHLYTTFAHGSRLLTGGATGPEGSLCAVPLLLLLGVLSWVWWRRGAAAWPPLDERIERVQPEEAQA